MSVSVFVLSYQVKNLLAADPYGKQAEKRKREVSDLESKVIQLEVQSSLMRSVPQYYSLHCATEVGGGVWYIVKASRLYVVVCEATVPCVIMWGSECVVV